VDGIEEVAAGRTVRKVEDSNKDNRFDTVTTWPDATNVIQETDSDGDGKLDVRSTFQGDTLVRQDADTNKDGRVDVWVVFAGGEKSVQEEDTNFDGRIDVQFTYAGGKMTKQEKVASRRPVPERAKPSRAPGLRRRDGSAGSRSAPAALQPRGHETSVLPFRAAP
jgi:hypothetical protein